MDKKLTIYDIKYLTEQNEPYFFSRKSMKYFGQTMKDFKVKYSPMGNIYIIAPIKHDNKIAGYTFKRFNPATNKLDNVQLEFYSNAREKEFNIHLYIDTH